MYEYEVPILSTHPHQQGPLRGPADSTPEVYSVCTMYYVHVHMYTYALIMYYVPMYLWRNSIVYLVLVRGTCTMYEYMYCVRGK